MARGITRKELKQDEIVDAAVGAKHWVEENWKQAAWSAGAVVVVVLLVVAWSSWTRRSEEAARQELAQALYRYGQAEANGWRAEELQPAMAGFDAVIDRAASSPAGAAAQFYRGAAMYRLGRLEEAVTALEDVSARTDAGATLRGTSRSLLAQVLADAGRLDEAIAVLDELSVQSDLYPTAAALLQLGRMHERNGNVEEARRVWERIGEDFPDSPVAPEARRLLGA